MIDPGIVTPLSCINHTPVGDECDAFDLVLRFVAIINGQSRRKALHSGYEFRKRVSSVRLAGQAAYAQLSNAESSMC